MQGVGGGVTEKKPGPDETKIKVIFLNMFHLFFCVNMLKVILHLQEILDRTGYELDYTTGQRKYGGPPPDWDGTQPGAGHEVSCWNGNVKIYSSIRCVKAM